MSRVLRACSGQASLSTSLALFRCWYNSFPGSADLSLLCAVHVKIKLGAGIKNAAAQSCILPDFSFLPSFKELPQGYEMSRKLEFVWESKLVTNLSNNQYTLKIFHGLKGACNGVDTGDREFGDT